MSDPLRSRLKDALSCSGGGSSDFDLNKGLKLPAGRKLRPAAVLVGITIDRQSIVLTKRSARLKHHPGQIAFPGGKQDPEDANQVDAALREAEEEIGLPRTAVEVLGTLPTHETVTGFEVTPVVALIGGTRPLMPEAGEVSEIFEVPLDFMMTPSNFRVESRRWQGVARRYYSVPHGPYYVWGATARILRGLAERMSA